MEKTPVLCAVARASSGQGANTAVVSLGRTDLNGSWILTSPQPPRVALRTAMQWGMSINFAKATGRKNLLLFSSISNCLGIFDMWQQKKHRGLIWHRFCPPLWEQTLSPVSPSRLENNRSAEPKVRPGLNPGPLPLCQAAGECYNTTTTTHAAAYLFATHFTHPFWPLSLPPFLLTPSHWEIVLIRRWTVSMFGR